MADARARRQDGSSRGGPLRGRPGRGVARTVQQACAAALLLVAAGGGLSACGPNAPSPGDATDPDGGAGVRDAAVASRDPSGGHAPAVKVARGRAGSGAGAANEDETDAAPPMSREEAERFIAAWNAIDTESEDGPAERGRIEKELVARGAAAIPGLISALRAAPEDDATTDAIGAVIGRLGPDAYLALAGCLDCGTGTTRAWIEDVLADCVSEWRSVPQGAAICRALVGGSERWPDFDPWGLLGEARPAARAVAADIARRATGDDAEDAAFGALEALGTDAADAAPLLAKWWAETDAARRSGGRSPSTGDGSEPGPEAGESEADAARADARLRERMDAVIRVLSSIGSADPSILPRLSAALDEGDDATARDVCRILATWGDAASGMADRLVPLLADERTRDDAAGALAGMSSVAPRLVLRALEVAASAATDPDWSGGVDIDCILEEWLSRADVASKFTQQCASLSGRAAVDGLIVLAHLQSATASDAARSLLSHEAPEARIAAAEHLAEHFPGHLPEGVEPLLADPEPAVRLAVIDACSASGSLAAERVRDLVKPFRGDADPVVRARVLFALAGAKAVARDDLAFCLAALADDDTRSDAFRAIAQIEGPLPAIEPDVLAAVARDCVRAWGDRAALIGALDRIPGGFDALLAATEAQFGVVDEETGRDDWWGRGRGFDVVALLGPRAEPLRAALAASRPEPGSDEESSWRIYGGAEALAALAGDADAFVGGMTTLYDADVAVLRRLGTDGRLAIALFAGGKPDPADFAELLVTLRDDPAMPAAVREASRVREADPQTDVRRAGAVRLAPLLPPAEATALLVRLAADDAWNVQEAVAEAIVERAASDPASVPVEAIRILLEAPGTDRTGVLAARAAYLLGPAASPCAGALRGAAVSTDRPEGLTAAIALRRVTDADMDLTPALRAVFAPVAAAATETKRRRDAWVGFCGSGREPDPDWPSAAGHTEFWESVGDAFADARPGPGDLQNLACVATIACGEASGNAALRGIERLGPVAAPIVGEIRANLARIDGSRFRSIDQEARDSAHLHAAARALAAIGPAARPAIPDLRRCAALLGDRDGVVRDAIARIEASR